jgi:hypothetical protein
MSNHLQLTTQILLDALAVPANSETVYAGRAITAAKT